MSGIVSEKEEIVKKNEIVKIVSRLTDAIVDIVNGDMDMASEAINEANLLMKNRGDEERIRAIIKKEREQEK